MEKYDLIIIGAGPGGYESAVYATENFGMKIAGNHFCPCKFSSTIFCATQYMICT